MHAGMPVITAEETRMERARGEDILVAFHNVVELVRIFARDVAERGFRETAGDFLGQFHSRNAPT